MTSVFSFIAWLEGGVSGPSESNWGVPLTPLSATLHLSTSDLVPTLLPTPESHAAPQPLEKGQRSPVLPRVCSHHL
jgi:hypothetical protein